MPMESGRLQQTAFAFLVLMLSFHTLQTAQAIKEMQVGVILDMGSELGKAIFRCITMALSDFYKANPHYTTRIVFDTKDTKGEPLIALSAVVDLFESTNVRAIIGPDPTVEARFWKVLHEKANIPILSFTKSVFTDPNPYFLQLEEETSQFKGITKMIQLFELNNIILICEDTVDGWAMASYVIMNFHGKNIHVTYTSQISPASTNEHIHEEFYKFQDVQTATFVMHTRPSLASNIFSHAKELGMMGEGYTWIVTSKTTNFLQFMNDDDLESMQGVVGFKSYFPKSRKFHKFVSRWIKEHYGNPFIEFKVLDFNGILAYDVVYALAMAVEKVHTKVDTKFSSVALRNQILRTNFHGLGGEFKLMNGRVVSNAIEVINVIGKGTRRVGLWMDSNEFVKEIGKTNSSFKSGLHNIIFPEGRTSTFSRRRLQMKRKKLRVIVPTWGIFPNLIQMAVDPRTNLPVVSGFCGDVFNAVLTASNYKFDIEFTQSYLVKGGSYNEIIDKVYFKEFDVAVGDITITANRSRYVDFTLPFSDMGVGTLTRNTKKSMWIFLDPLSANLWITSAGFFLILGFVIWFIEHDTNDEFQGESLKSNLSRFVVIIWLFVVLVLTSSYTATLSSLITVQQISTTVGSVQLPGISTTVFNASAGIKTAADYAKVLRSGRASAIIDEILYIKTVIALYSSSEFSIVATTTTTNGFAFVFQKDSTLTREFSATIAKLREDGTLKVIEDKWLKQPYLVTSDDQFSPPPNSLDLYGLRGLFLTSGLSIALAVLGSMVYHVYEKWRGKSRVEILRSIFGTSPQIYAQEIVAE